MMTAEAEKGEATGAPRSQPNQPTDGRAEAAVKEKRRGEREGGGCSSRSRSQRCS